MEGKGDFGYGAMGSPSDQGTFMTADCDFDFEILVTD